MSRLCCGLALLLPLHVEAAPPGTAVGQVNSSSTDVFLHFLQNKNIVEGVEAMDTNNDSAISREEVPLRAHTHVGTGDNGHES